MHVRSVKPEDFDACLDLLGRVFTDAPRAFFERYFDGDPWFKPDYTRVCEEDGAIVSLVQIVRREVRVGCSTLTMGGIANVGTPPEHRGKGYSTAALKSAIEVMTAGGMDFSMLFTGINPFYERLGWATVNTAHGTARLRRRLPPIQHPYSVRSYRPEDAEAVVGIYNEFNACRSMTVARTPDYWTRFAADPRADESGAGAPYDIWVAELDGRIAAYAAGHRFRQSYGIAEMCCRAGHERALPALAREPWARARDLRAREVVCRLSNEEAVRSAVREIAVPLPARTYPYMMFRVLNLSRTFEKILPELERRSAGLKGRGRATLATEFGDVTLDAAPGCVTISLEPADSRVQLTQSGLFGLLFGLVGPRTVARVGPARDLLAALFPRQPAVYYAADGF